MKYSIERKNNDELIIRIKAEENDNDFDWVHDYFKALFEMHLPQLLDDNLEEDDNGYSYEGDDDSETLCNNKA